MTTSIQYLETAKIEEVASRLRGEGYEVTMPPIGHDEGYDIVASKGDKRVAVEVKVNSQLRDSTALIKTLHKRALERGYDEFRLVVVSPPREVKVSIEKLEAELFKYMEQNLPATLAGGPVQSLAQFDVSKILLTGIGEIDIDSIDITTDGVQAVGNGVAEIEIIYWDIQEEPSGSAGFQPHDGRYLTSWETAVPFTFDVILKHDLTISDARNIEVDTSTFP